MAGAGREDERLLVGHLQGAVDGNGGDAAATSAARRQVLAAVVVVMMMMMAAVDFAVRRAVPCHIPVATLLHLQFLHAKEGT